jgi:hypothetical protein
MAHGIEIKQTELAEISELQRQFDALAAKLADRKSRIIPLLQAGFPVESGRFAAHLVKRVGRSGLSYKQLAVNELGADVVDAYKKQFPTHVFFELEVVEHAVPPLWKGREQEWNDGA